MAMTNEEKRERNAQNRSNRQYAAFESLKAEIDSLWIRARREGTSHKDLIQWQQDNLWSNPRYLKLPSSFRFRLQGIWECHQWIAYREHMVFCYPHPDTRIITPSRIICDEGLAGKLHDTSYDKEGAHYWRNEDGTFSKPFNLS